MALFELETIEPPDKGPGASSLSGKALKDLEDAAFARGYKMGVEAANKGLAAEQNQYLAGISETLSDQGFEYRKANARAEAAVAELVAAIAETLAPELARSHFDELVSARIRQAAGQLTDGALTLRLSPQAECRMGELLAGLAVPLEVKAEPEFAPLQAKLSWEAGIDTLDLQGALDLIGGLMSEYVKKLKDQGDERHRNAG